MIRVVRITTGTQHKPLALRPGTLVRVVWVR